MNLPALCFPLIGINWRKMKWGIANLVGYIMAEWNYDFRFNHLGDNSTSMKSSISRFSCCNSSCSSSDSQRALKRDVHSQCHSVK